MQMRARTRPTCFSDPLWATTPRDHNRRELTTNSSTSIRCLAAAVALVAVATPAHAVAQARRLVISGVVFDGVLSGTPASDLAVRLTNPSADQAVALDGLVISDRYTTSRYLPREIYLPAGAVIGPGEDVWIAHQATAFRKVFGFAPTYEAVDTDPSVPNVRTPSGWLRLLLEHGALAVVEATGAVVDFVAYSAASDATVVVDELPPEAWSGPPVYLYKTTANTGWEGRILNRDRDEGGRVLPDTDGAQDWNGGFSAKHLGEEATHRLEYPGQTSFVADPRVVLASVRPGSSPDNSFEAFTDILDAATQEILLSTYSLTNFLLVDRLRAARSRGVKVAVWLESAPVGGLPPQERYLVSRLVDAGCEVAFLATPQSSKIRKRYHLDHSKYALIDNRIAIIGTENATMTGLPPATSFGNRGWMIQIEEPSVVAKLRAVWDADYRPGVFADVVPATIQLPGLSDSLALPWSPERFVPVTTSKFYGGYEVPLAVPAPTRDLMTIELVLSPDDSLNEHSGIIGLLNRSTSTLLVEQSSVPGHWGPGVGTAEEFGNLPLEAVIAAARRGVRTRVLLDGRDYDPTDDEPSDNDATVVTLTNLAHAEGLDLEVKLTNLTTACLSKIHTKGVVVDGTEVLVGSMNWTEESLKHNREVGVIVSHPAVASYYAGTFARDWSESVLQAGAFTAVTEGYASRLMTDVVATFNAGDKADVVGRQGGTVEQPAILEIRTGMGQTAYVDATTVSFAVPMVQP